MTARIAMVSLGLVVASGCSDNSWDEEIVIQLFKPSGTETGTITVTATQGGKAKDETVSDAFRDCDANRVRIIPDKQDGAYADVNIEVKAEKGSLAPVSTVVSIPASSPVKMVLGSGSDLQPSACAPAGGGDGGVDGGIDGSGGDGSSSGNRPIGDPCQGPGDCLGTQCLDDWQSNGDPRTLPGGYCSQPCTTTPKDDCPDGSRCAAETNGFGTAITFHCVKKCDGSECRDGYKCMTQGHCLVD